MPQQVSLGQVRFSIIGILISRHAAAGLPVIFSSTGPNAVSEDAGVRVRVLYDVEQDLGGA
jgi:hypothetical protein